jgi:hypothetical protein
MPILLLRTTPGHFYFQRGFSGGTFKIVKTKCTGLWRSRLSETIKRSHRRLGCRIGNIANTGIRTAAGTKSGKSNLPKSRSRKRRLGRAQSRCRARIRFPAARNVALCCRQSRSRLGNVRSAASNSTPAGNVHTLTPRAGSNARNLSPKESRVRTSAISARFIPCGFE